MKNDKLLRYHFSTLFDKNHREVTNTWIASLAFLLAVISLILGELHYWSARRATFTIDVESEYKGPIAITKTGNHYSFEGFVKIVITNPNERRITISTIAASMKNDAVVSDKGHVIETVYGVDQEPVEAEDLPFDAIDGMFFTTAVKTTVPWNYSNEIELPFNIEPYSSRSIYVKVRTLILESPKVVDDLKEILKENPKQTSGQFLGEAIKRGYGRLIHIRRDSGNLVTATSGPDRAMLEIRVKSIDGLLRKQRIGFP
ncbi:MAG: hypothetical protein ISS70_15885 [Phycisphaerae bacterium]|nr:hypothetical protein [Phycisphaerae bacterium]